MSRCHVAANSDGLEPETLVRFGTMVSVDLGCPWAQLPTWQLAGVSTPSVMVKGPWARTSKKVA